MLQLRQEQLDALAQAKRAALAKSLLEHVQECFPQHVRALGREQTQRVINVVLARAAELELQSDHDVCELVNLVFVLGDRFEDDPEFAWATEILRDTGVAPAARMRELRRLTTAYLTRRK